MASRSPIRALALCLLLVAACDRKQDGSAPLQPEAAPQGTPDGGDARETGVRLALLQPSANTDLAALEGSLHAEGRCLYIVGSDKAKNRTLPAFALADVRWDERTRSLRVGGRTFAQDQRVVLGGGEPSNPSALKWVQRPDPSCDSSDLFVVGTIDPAGR